MSRLLVASFLVCLVPTSWAINSFEDYASFIQKTSLNETFLKQYGEYFDKRNQLYNEKNFPNGNDLLGAPMFKCPMMNGKSKTRPTNVNSLMPGDIAIVGALGDSLTAALGAGAMNLLEMLLEYRGMSFTIGGDGSLKYMATVPNILKTFNKDLVGASERVAPVWFEYFSQLNVAVSGARADNLTDQAHELVKRMKALKGIDYKNEWKLVTIFVGSNDLCHFCEDQTRYAASSFYTSIKNVLDLLKQELPRTFVNLMTEQHISLLRQTNQQSSYCKDVHNTACPCLNNANLDDMNKAYQEKARQLADEYQEKSDFTVVAQPFSEHTTLPKTANGDVDFSFFAPDCFHFSQWGHSLSAKGLWANMMEPVGQKTTKIDLNNVETKCPSSNCPLLRTAKNSVNCGAHYSLGNFMSMPTMPMPDPIPSDVSMSDDMSSMINRNRLMAEQSPKIELKVPSKMSVDLNVKSDQVSGGTKFGFTILGILLGLLVGVAVSAFLHGQWSKKHERQMRELSEKSPLLGERNMVQIY